MTPAIASLQLLLLTLNWTADPGTTYTVQTSNDLAGWQTLPFVVEGEGQQESHPIDLSGSPSFARLQFNTNGDSNENGLPDLWEWTHFGHLDSDPDADPDGDGHSTYTEWLNTTDPTDFFNGEIPVITVSSGSEWFVPAGEAATQTLAVGVYHLNGDPWSQAPVHIEFESGFDGIIDEQNSLASGSIEIRSDSLGRLDSSTAGFHFLAPTQVDSTERIHIRCGEAASRFNLRTTQSLPGGPPRQLDRNSLSDTIVEYLWSGSLEGVTRFRIQEQDSSGNWIEMASLDPTELPEPDPATGRFTLETIPVSN